MSRPESGNTGVIHDIGYQRYEGPRLGRRYATRSLYVQGVRGAFGIGRGPWAKVLPMGVFALVCLASLILVVVNSQLPVRALNYVGIAATFSYAATVFVAIVAPELVSGDLRHKVLSLYLSRPLTRSDYALARLAALATAAFVLYAGPMLVMLVGMLFNSSDGFSGILDELGLFLVGLVAAVIHAVVLAALALPLASLSGRRVFATGIVMAVFLLTAPITGALRSFDSGTLGQLAGLLDPVSLLNGVDRWLFDEGVFDIGSNGPVYGLVAVLLTALGVYLAMVRYRRVRA